MVDRHWGPGPVDLQVGDTLLLPTDATVSGPIAVVSGDDRALLTRAQAPGQGRASSRREQLHVAVRVSRRGYVGRNMYRFLEEADNA